MAMASCFYQYMYMPIVKVVHVQLYDILLCLGTKKSRSEVEHATSRSRRLPAILTFTRGSGRNIFVSFKPPRPGTEL